MTPPSLGGGPQAGPARLARTELDAAAWETRILDPERMRPVVVVASATRSPAERLDPERIADALGVGVDVVAVPTGSLAWVLELRPAVGVTPATLPGPPSPTRRATPASTGAARAAQASAGPDPSARPVGPTPANPRGAPPRRPQGVPAAVGAPAQTAPAQTAPAQTGPAIAAGSRSAGTAGAAKPAQRARLSAAGLWHARSDRDGATLAGHLLAEGRRHPVLVVSTPDEDAPPLVDAEDLHRRVGELADVVVLHNGPASWAFAEAMPHMTQVYGGAGRVYPVDLRWTARPSRAPLRFCWPSDDPARVADQLEDDAYAAAHVAGLLTLGVATGALSEAGVVKGPFGRHHIVLALDRGGDAVMLVDALCPGVEPDRLLAPGQRLTGRVRPDAMLRPFAPDPIPDDPRRRVEVAYGVGDVVLARITEVAARTATALLHPRVAVQVRADDDEPDLRNLVAEGDVVTLTLQDPAGGVLHAELADASAPSVACVPVLPDGPPWLVEDDLPTPAEAEPPEAETAEEQHEAAAPATPTRPVAPAAGEALSPATVGLHARLAGLQAQVDDLANRLRVERAEAHRQSQAATRARDEAKRLRRQLRSLKDQHDAYRARQDGQALFADPEDQLRHDIEQAWLRRVPEPERAQWPLAGYELGPGFLSSLDALEGISRDKVIDVLVEVLIDRAKDINGRDLHPLRTGEGAQDQRTRDDGARAWRCALQLNTPSARRLHFWRLSDGTIELDQVGTHDEGL